MSLNITEPRRPTEFELQAELYSYLKVNGWNVRGEVGHRWVKNGRQGCRFDLVVFLNGLALAIIEVKDTAHTKVLNGKQTRQTRKYSEFGIPVIYYTSIVSIESVESQLREAVIKIS